jgi:hypothetical protein
VKSIFAGPPSAVFKNIHKIIMPVYKNIKIDKSNLSQKYDPEIFAIQEHAFDGLNDHKAIARNLKNKNPYTITVIIDNLNSKFWNNKKYVEKTRLPKHALYVELLYKYFFAEFDHREGNELYAKWLDKYRDLWKKEEMKKELDDYIIKNELEPRYREKILKKYKNHEKLFKPRVEINEERYYNLSSPLNHVDWRNPYDNIFVWEENGKKVFRKGGSGSSGGREVNSRFIFGFSLINKTKPIKSYLFLYSDDNKLYFIKEFSELTVPRYDIGCNYHLKSKEEERILSKTNLIEWKDFAKLSELKVDEK